MSLCRTFALLKILSPNVMQIDSFCVKEPLDLRTTAPHVLPIYAT